MPLEVSSTLIDELLAAAEAAQPRECCGLLLGQGNQVHALRAADNVHQAPESHFEIDPAVLIDAHRSARGGGPQILGYYHSHPNGRTGPSPTDVAMAAPDGMVWAIVAAGGVRFWQSGDAGMTPLPYLARPR